MSNVNVSQTKDTLKIARFPLKTAAVAQLGERQTEDLKVPGLIPGYSSNHHCMIQRVSE